jgi:hypothetical protein
MTASHKMVYSVTELKTDDHGWRCMLPTWIHPSLPFLAGFTTTYLKYVLQVKGQLQEQKEAEREQVFLP